MEKTAKFLLTFSHYARPHLEYGGSVVNNKLGCQIYMIVYQFMFVL